MLRIYSKVVDPGITDGVGEWRSELGWILGVMGLFWCPCTCRIYPTFCSEIREWKTYWKHCMYTTMKYVRVMLSKFRKGEILGFFLILRHAGEYIKHFFWIISYKAHIQTVLRHKWPNCHSLNYWIHVSIN